jgi:hypothetical protein
VVCSTKRIEDSDWGKHWIALRWRVLQALPFFGLRRFSAAFLHWVFKEKLEQQSGGKAPQSKNNAKPVLHRHP